MPAQPTEQGAGEEIGAGGEQLQSHPAAEGVRDEARPAHAERIEQAAVWAAYSSTPHASDRGALLPMPGKSNAVTRQLRERQFICREKHSFEER